MIVFVEPEDGETEEELLFGIQSFATGYMWFANEYDREDSELTLRYANLMAATNLTIVWLRSNKSPMSLTEYYV